MAPSELKANVDYPLIQCNAIDSTNTNFRYKIAQQNPGTTATATATLTSGVLSATIGTA